MISNVQLVEISGSVKFSIYLLSDAAPLGAVRARRSVSDPRSNQIVSRFLPQFEGFDSARLGVNLVKKPHFSLIPFPKRASDSELGGLYAGAPSKPAEEVAANFQPIADRSLALEWLLTPKSAEVCLSERVLARLVQAEAHEPDVSLRDDIRQTFVALSLAIRSDVGALKASAMDAPAKGHEADRTGPPHPLPMCFIRASYSMYGLHPDKVWPAILAKRKALIGPEFTQLRQLPSPGKSKEERKKLA
jgi:hypothetical protein